MAHRQVLFLGNGLNLAYGGVSWQNLIRQISVRNDFDPDQLRLPLPMQAILVTNNNIRDSMKSKSKDFYGTVNPAQAKALTNLLDLGFEDILTTNYSYEIESAALEKESLNEPEVKRLLKSTSHAETRYLLHTYNSVKYNGNDCRVWHIHGESRKPDSMILGHYWYGNMLAKMKETADKRSNYYEMRQRNGQPVSYDSWIDSFILGDVYVLGMGFNPAEIDLWWLLNRKLREKADKGKLYFYEMKNESEREKIELMKLLGAEVIDFGMLHPDKTDPDRGEKYRAFYDAAAEDIRSKMQKEK